MRTNPKTFACGVAVFVLAAAAFLGHARLGAAEPNSPNRVSQDTRAFLVVTGMRVQEGPDGVVVKKDLAVGEGATVRVARKGGPTEEKRTVAFGAGGPREGTGHFSADFAVDLDATYEITMTFGNGTVVRIGDYRLPREWRTHFYFHNTRGTKSPASVLRIGRDAASGLACYVYAVFPIEAYRSLGGRQIEP
jgi:hypothetical protein